MDLSVQAAPKVFGGLVFLGFCPLVEKSLPSRARLLREGGVGNYSRLEGVPGGEGRCRYTGIP